MQAASGVAKGDIEFNGTFLQIDGNDFWSPGDFIIAPDSTLTLTPFADSMAGPILNAMEVFSKSDPRLDKTTGRDGELRLFQLSPPNTALQMLLLIFVKTFQCKSCNVTHAMKFCNYCLDIQFCTAAI